MFSYDRICSLTIECVLLQVPGNAWVSLLHSLPVPLSSRAASLVCVCVCVCLFVCLFGCLVYASRTKGLLFRITGSGTASLVMHGGKVGGRTEGGREEGRE